MRLDWFNIVLIGLMVGMSLFISNELKRMQHFKKHQFDAKIEEMQKTGKTEMKVREVATGNGAYEILIRKKVEEAKNEQSN